MTGVSQALAPRSQRTGQPVVAGHPISPLRLARTVWSRRNLIAQLVKRESIGRYKGASLGAIWLVLTPLLMLTIFTFVFSEVFKARWTPPSGVTTTGGKAEFALVLFAGLSVFNFFSECVQKASTLIVGNVSYVKKVVFPLEVLPIISAFSALVHFLVSVLLLLLMQWLIWERIPSTAPLLILVIIPLFLQILGVSWFLSSLAVFVRDIGQTVGVLLTALMFLSPIFFPASSLPEQWRFVSTLNPLAYPIEETRRVLIWGQVPDTGGLVLSVLVSCFIAWLGFAFFQKSRRGFADVL